MLIRRRRVAAWQRWAGKKPENRVRWVAKRNGVGQVVGYGPAIPLPEPQLPSIACRQLMRPSGRMEVELKGPSGKELRRLQEAYRLVRKPKPTPDEVEPLPVTGEEVQRWLAEVEAA